MRALPSLQGFASLHSNNWLLLVASILENLAEVTKTRLWCHHLDEIKLSTVAMAIVLMVKYSTVIPKDLDSNPTASILLKSCDSIKRGSGDDSRG